MLIKHQHRMVNPYAPRRGVMQGSGNPRAVLTDDDVRRLRRLYQQGTTQPELAAKYGISRNHVSNIVTRKNWRHI